MGSCSAWSRLPRSLGYGTSNRCNRQSQSRGTRGHAVDGQRSCQLASDMQPYLCHDGRHLVTWLVRGELTVNATPPIGTQIEDTRTWLLPGNQATLQSPRSCRCARCVFCSITRPHPRHRHCRKHKGRKWKTNKRLMITPRNSKLGAWISLELPSSTTASCFSHVCASATPDWCIASSTASHIITYSQTVHVTSLKLQGQTMRTFTAREVPATGSPNLRCPRSPGSQQGSQIHLNGHACCCYHLTSGGSIVLLLLY